MDVFKRILKTGPNFTKFDLALTFSEVKIEIDCHHGILRHKWFIKRVSHDICARFSFGDLFLPDLDFDLDFTFTFT